MIIKVPYRINWAGAYLDCINEPVITSTINKYIIAESQPIDDDFIIVYSKEKNESYKTILYPKIRQFNFNNWTDYVDGCIAAFGRFDIKLNQGCLIKVSNDLPSGLGLSSSAAFIVAILKSISKINELNLKDSVIAELGYWAEHDYLGIPCGRMDFKAVLHKPGLWKINTDTCDLFQDKLISKETYSGIIVYKQQHNNAGNKKFLDTVAKIRNTKFNYSYDKETAKYISCEESIVNCINHLNYDIDIQLLASYLDSSNTNITKWLDIPADYFNQDGIYGSKILGSGINGAHFLLVSQEKQYKILQALAAEYTAESIEI